MYWVRIQEDPHGEPDQKHCPSVSQSPNTHVEKLTCVIYVLFFRYDEASLQPLVEYFCFALIPYMFHTP